jgi:hypothetical protein
VKREHIRQRGKESLELIEEAIHLLRLAPSSCLALYYSGTLPFVLAALYFWADMSRSPFAGQHLVGGALALACLFLWMKTCQSLFARRMRCLLSDEKPALSVGQMWRIFVTESALQPTGLFVVPLALLLSLPFGWVFAFYQNLSALDDGESLDPRSTIRQAIRQAMLWPRQNHIVLLTMSGFGLFVWINVISACFMLPSLMKLVFGIETTFTRSGLSLLNSTLFAATFALVYVCIDPIIKTIYALRCFYGESQRSGADLKAELKWAGAAPIATVLLACVMLSSGAPDARAAEPSEPERPVPVRGIAPAELNETIQQVIRLPKYSWRQPRQKLVEQGTERPGIFGRLLERIKPFVRD